MKPDSGNPILTDARIKALLHEGAMIDAVQSARRAEDFTPATYLHLFVDDPDAIVSIGKGTWCLHRDDDGKWFRQDARSGGWRLTDLTDTDMQELQEKIKP